MIKIDEALVSKVKGLTELIENEINFADLVKIVTEQVKFFDQGITAPAALILFKKDRDLIWGQTKEITSLWDKAERDDFSKICLTKAALLKICQSNVAQYREKRTRETVTISRGIKANAKITINQHLTGKSVKDASNYERE